MKKLLLAISLLLILAVTGCAAGTGRTSYRDGAGNTNTGAESQDSSGADSAGVLKSPGTGSMKVGAASTNKIQKKAVVKSSNTAEESAGDLVIKSDNQVMAGSKQAMVDQIDKEMDGLMNSLNKLESVDSRDLEME